MVPRLASLKLSLRYLLPFFETGSYNVDLACLEFAMYTKLAWNLEKSIHPYFPRTGIKGVHCRTKPTLLFDWHNNRLTFNILKVAEIR